MLPKRLYGNVICLYKTDLIKLEKDSNILVVGFIDEKEDPIFMLSESELKNSEKYEINYIGEYTKRYMEITVHQDDILRAYAKRYGLTPKSTMDAIFDEMATEINYIYH